MRAGLRIRKLAAAGAYIANDFENYFECQHGGLFGKLKEAGVIHLIESAGTKHERRCPDGLTHTKTRQEAGFFVLVHLPGLAEAIAVVKAKQATV